MFTVYEILLLKPWITEKKMSVPFFLSIYISKFDILFKIWAFMRKHDQIIIKIVFHTV